MFRISVEIRSVATFPGNRRPDNTPEISVETKADNLLDAVNKAIRIMTGERDAIRADMPTKKGMNDPDLAFVPKDDDED